MQDLMPASVRHFSSRLCHNLSPTIFLADKATSVHPDVPLVFIESKHISYFEFLQR